MKNFAPIRKTIESEEDHADFTAADELPAPIYAAQNKRAARAKESARRNCTTNNNYSAPAKLDALLSGLERVKQTGPGRWVASCPTRRDKNPSMTIRQLDDGRILMHDFGGSSTEEILDALNMDWTALFPERAADYARPERHPFPAADVLRAIAFEALVVAAAAGALRRGTPLSEADHDRLMRAMVRIQSAVDMAGGRYGRVR